MRIRIIALLTAVCAAAMLCSCAEKEADGASETTAEARSAEMSETAAAAKSAEMDEALAETAAGAEAPVLNSKVSEEPMMTEPFSSYTFIYSDSQDNYLITISPGEHSEPKSEGAATLPLSVILTCEDKNFASHTVEAKAPEGYYVGLPYDEKLAYTACTVIKNDIDQSAVPQLIKLDFWLYDVDKTEELPYSVSKFYAVYEGKLSEVKMIDNTKQEGGELPYCPSQLLHTEPAKLMETPVTEVTERGVSLQIYTYTYNAENNTLTRNVEPPVQDNMLYFGYSYYYKAMETANYMYMTTPPVEDYENYIETEVTSGESSYTVMYFPISDPRFSTYEELREYMLTVFSERLTDDMLSAAPMQYKDFDGQLYGIIGDGGMNINLGPVTITGYELSEDGQTITFHTRQLTLDDQGAETGYTDGGDFVLTADPESSGYIVTKFRYPYL